MNECHANAECHDLPGGYACNCKQPFVDKSPTNSTGRLCVFDECAHTNSNNCHENAECVELDEGFSCVCKEGFYDNSKNPLEPGRLCLGKLCSLMVQVWFDALSFSTFRCRVRGTRGGGRG